MMHQKIVTWSLSSLFCLICLAIDKFSPFAVLGANSQECFDEFIAMSDSIGDDCTKRDWDHVGDGSKCNSFLCIVPSCVIK